MSQGTPQTGSRGSNGWLIGGGVLLALLLVFIFQNTADTEFKFLFWSFTQPLWLVLLVTAIVAFVVGQFALMWRRHRRRKARRDGR
jgi:LPXTG-motif cell wall-anchored protein